MVGREGGREGATEVCIHVHRRVEEEAMRGGQRKMVGEGGREGGRGREGEIEGDDHTSWFTLLCLGQ